MSGPSAESGGELRSGLRSNGIVAFIRARLDWRLECIRRGVASTEVPRAEWEQWDWVWDGRREVEALRRIVDLHDNNDPSRTTIDGEPACEGCNANWVEEWAHSVEGCPTKRLLASIWRSHPDFDPAWAPEEARAAQMESGPNRVTVGGLTDAGFRMLDLLDRRARGEWPF